MTKFNLHIFLKKICCIKNATFADVAKKAGMSTQCFSGIMTRNNATFSSLEKIADALNCDIEINFIDRETGENALKVE